MKTKFILIILTIILFVKNSFSQIEERTVESAQAIYIYNFTKNIDWQKRDINEFIISVVGTSFAYIEIKKYMENKNFINKPIKVIHVKDINELKESQIIYFSYNKYKFISDIQKKFNNSNILYITEINNALKNGSCINFYMEGEKLKFEINEENIKNQKLRITISLISSAKPQN
jgi:hypothetical protein